jgi:hypothetical protein
MTGNSYFPTEYTTLSNEYPTLGQEKKVVYLGGLNS